MFSSRSRNQEELLEELELMLDELLLEEEDKLLLELDDDELELLDDKEEELELELLLLLEAEDCHASTRSRRESSALIWMRMKRS